MCRGGVRGRYVATSLRRYGELGGPGCRDHRDACHESATEGREVPAQDAAVTSVGSWRRAVVAVMELAGNTDLSRLRLNRSCRLLGTSRHGCAHDGHCH
jgi:hypothetical protein